MKYTIFFITTRPDRFFAHKAGGLKGQRIKDAKQGGSGTEFWQLILKFYEVIHLKEYFREKMCFFILKYFRFYVSFGVL